MKLTDLTIKSLPLGLPQRDYRDSAVSGLSIRVGAKTKTFMVMVGRTKRRRVKLGLYPDLSLSAAREKAKDVLAQERLNPSAAVSMTVEAALKTYYRVRAAERRDITSRCCEGMLEKYFRPKLAKRQLTSIRSSDITAILDELLDKPGSRQIAFAFIRAFFNWCYRREYIDASPVARLEAPPVSKPRERVLTSEELCRVWRACGQNPYGDVIRLCMLSGQRIGQWLKVQPSYIGADCIVWPAETMKGDRIQMLPLTPMIRTILDNSDIPFSCVREGRKKDALDNAARVHDWTHHDLRRTWATISAEVLGTEPHIIDAVLAHASGSPVSRIYNRARYQEPMRKALLAFEEWLQQQLSKAEVANDRDFPELYRERSRAAQ